MLKDIELKRKEMGYSPNNLAIKILQKGPLKTRQSQMSYDPNNKNSYRTLGNYIRDLENGKLTWWNRPENMEALVRLAGVLEISVEDIPLDENSAKTKRLYFWEDLKEARPFDPLNESFADTGLRDCISCFYKSFRQYLPNGWGRRFLAHYYHHKYGIPVYYLRDLSQWDKVFNFAFQKYSQAIICIDDEAEMNSYLMDSENAEEKESLDRLGEQKSLDGLDEENDSEKQIILLTPFKVSKESYLYSLPAPFQLSGEDQFDPSPDWRDHFVIWLCERLQKKEGFCAKLIIEILSSLDPKARRFSSPKDLVPIISLCYKKGVEACQKYIKEGEWAKEKVLMELGKQKEIASAFHRIVGKIAINPKNLLQEHFFEEEWIQLLEEENIDNSSEALEKIKKAKLIIVDEERKYKAPDWYLGEVFEQKGKSLVKKNDFLLGSLMLDSQRQYYFDKIVDDIDELSWEKLIKVLVKRFEAKSLHRVAEIEWLFAAAGRKPKRFHTLGLKKVYKKLFQLQMTTLFLRHSDGLLAEPLTRPWEYVSLKGVKWINVCWVWDLSNIVTKSMVPSYAQTYFPIHGDPEEDIWGDYVYNTAIYDAPAGPRRIPRDTRDAFHPDHKKYLIFLKLGRDIIKKREFSISAFKKNFSLFPIWLVEQITQGKKPELQSFDYLLSPSLHLWSDYLTYFASKCPPKTTKDIATHLLAECIRKKKDFLDLLVTIQDHSPQLIVFFEKHADFESLKKTICDGILPSLSNQKPNCGYSKSIYEKMEKVSDKWRKLFFDSLIDSEEGKTALARFIENLSRLSYDYRRSLVLKSAIKKRHWEAIMNEIELSWDLTRLVWDVAPTIAIKQANLLLRKDFDQARYWFLLSSASSKKELCDELLLFQEQSSQPIPEWCRLWVANVINLPSLRYIAQDLYEKILYSDK